MLQLPEIIDDPLVVSNDRFGRLSLDTVERWPSGFRIGDLPSLVEPANNAQHIRINWAMG